VEVHLARTYRASRYDALTGVANRPHLMEWLEGHLVSCRLTGGSMGLIFIDVDRFKAVNDTMGHAVGDQLLKEVARRLSGAVRSGDLVARLAGDEFVIAFPGVASPDKLVELAERVQHMFDPAVDLGTGPFYASLSMGLALADGGVEDVATLLEQADAAMYVAKNTPGTRYAFFDDALRAEADTRQATGEALRLALDAGELDLHYQPIVAMPDRRVVAVEAFVRWNRPGYGVLTPGSFLDVAEETGLIGAIGRLVMVEACHQAARWSRRPDLADVPITVNVSERQLLAPDFLAVVEAALAETGIDPFRLHIELHEDLADDKRVRACGVLAGLRALGVGLVIDDFGFRSGSLGILKDLPLSMVKIHGSAVTDLVGNDADQVLVEAVVNVATVQGAIPVAEHVETIEQLSTLAALGVNHVQGHLLAPPMSAAELGALISGRCLVPPAPAVRLLAG
jgi:diguanylate cyclase (GGDEF)-like protein